MMNGAKRASHDNPDIPTAPLGATVKKSLIAEVLAIRYEIRAVMQRPPAM
jgi:hypothetical protein